MTTKTIMLGKRNQITLPSEFVPQGTSLFHAEKQKDGSILLEPQVTIPARQAYFWTKRWQEGENQVDREISEGRLGPPMSADELIKFFEKRRKTRKSAK